MERRIFLQKSCLACGSLLLMNAMLSSCSTLPLVQGKTEDQQMFISKMEFAQSNVIIARSNKIDTDILIRKKENSFVALRMMCSHEEQPLTATADQLHCASHGSSFNMEGEVLREPATKPLKKYRITETENDIIIHLNQFI